ncbi:hypothetical protein FACS1894158_16700 [Betaproteobacteria bacterium]|nr:hypothetical protein FACS1894158_16700 [Betaproteobacteria bacterium]
MNKLKTSCLISTMVLMIIASSACSMVTRAKKNLESPHKKITLKEQPQYEATLKNKPLHKNPLRFDVTQFGLQNEGVASLEEARAKYPAQVWTPRTFLISNHLSHTVPGTTNSIDFNYFEGLDNAKSATYSALLDPDKSGTDTLRNFKRLYYGRKLILLNVDDENQASYKCNSFRGLGFGIDADKNSFYCEASAYLRLLVAD